jgi:hypothetical protein
LATSNKNFKVKNGLTVDSLTVPGVLVNDSSGNITASTTPSVSTLTASGTINATGDITTAGFLKSTNSSGDEGGQIDLAKPVSNTSLTTGVTIDVYQNKIRIFETGGSNRGYYIDIASGANSAGTNLLTGGSGGGISLTSLSASSPIVYNNTTGAFSLGTIDGGRIV